MHVNEPMDQWEKAHGPDYNDAEHEKVFEELVRVCLPFLEEAVTAVLVLHNGASLEKSKDMAR